MRILLYKDVKYVNINNIIKNQHRSILSKDPNYESKQVTNTKRKNRVDDYFMFFVIVFSLT